MMTDVSVPNMGASHVLNTTSLSSYISVDAPSHQKTSSMPASKGKRTHEVIDLTRDDSSPAKAESRPEKLARTSSISNGISSSQASRSSYPSSSQLRNGFPSSQTSYTPTLSQSGQAVYDELYGGDDFDQEEDASERFDAYILSLQQYGVMPTKIVGCRYYNGYITTGESVLLIREPTNEHDANAIRVDNVRSEKIGHIPRQVAAKLAPFMDSKDLFIEGLCTGPKGYYDCPLQLNLFGSSDPELRSDLMSRMREQKLPVGDARKNEQFDKARAKEEARFAKQAKKAGAAGVGAAQFDDATGQWTGGLSQGDGNMAMDHILQQTERFSARHNFEEMVEKFGLNEEALADMPMIEQPEGLESKLLPYQRQGLRWLLDKEKPSLPAPGSKDSVQLWQRNEKDSKIVTHMATHFSLQNQFPELASGGILADDMGLGKTVQIISLLLADPLRAQHVANGGAGATLIISPMSVMSNWNTQIGRHISNTHCLQVLTYHGQGKIPIDAKKIRDFDVVITTYETVMMEYQKSGYKNPNVLRKNGLFSINWRRVVLDEGHTIRNPSAKKSTAACQLTAMSRWVLTGTPIVNTLKDLFSIVKFLRLSGGIDAFELFNSTLIRPVNQGDPKGNALLQALMQSICLRRKKDMKFVDLNLPELDERLFKVKLQVHEQEKYDYLEAEAKGTLDNYRKGRGKNGTTNAYNHLLEVLIRLRQVCNHWELCPKDRFDLPDTFGTALQLTPEVTAALQAALKLKIEAQEDCPICMDTMDEPVITACTHTFCFPCIERVINEQKKCPFCRAELESIAKLVKPAVEADEVTKVSSTSSKIEALLSILKATRAKGDGTKTIIFSQWTSFLDIVQKHLKEEGFKHSRIDGKMTAKTRDAAIEALDEDPNCTVMLASLGVCSVGLNLVAASQVILADTWWAPAIEDQAVDRVHRLGQTKQCTVWRLVVEGSVEEKVLDIQQNKRKLMQLALSDKKGKRSAAAKTTRLADIERLLGASKNGS